MVFESLSNKNFSYDAEKGTVTPNPPDSTTLNMDCEIRLTYKGTDTLFVTSPIAFTIHLSWEKTYPKYSVRFYNDTYLGAWWNQETDDWSAFTYWADSSTKAKETTYVAGDVIALQTATAPTKAGYDFAGWRITSLNDGIAYNTSLADLNNLEGFIMPEENIDIAAFYTPRTDTPFVVEYYVETIDGTGGYELYKSVQHTGKTGSADQDNDYAGEKLAELIEEDMGDTDGLHINWALYPYSGTGEFATFGSFYIHGDGSTVVKVYYDRERYSVYFHANNEDYAGTQTTQINGVYGAPLSAPSDIGTVDIPGWTFLGWADDQDATVSNLEIPQTIPTDTGRGGTSVGTTYYGDGTHYFGVWKPNYNYITVNHYVENVDGSYSLVETQVGSNENEETHKLGGLTGTYLDPNDFLIEVDGATSALDTTAQHNGQTLDIYYDREYFRATWKGVDRDIVEYYYVGQEFTAPEGLVLQQKQGYAVDGWKNTLYLNTTEIYREEEGMVMPDHALILEPNYVPADGTPYTVIHKRLDHNIGGKDKIETETLYGVTDSIVPPEVKKYDGYVAPEAAKLFIKADGTAAMTYSYEPASYGLTLDFNGGTEAGYARNYFYDTIFDLPTNITREGYDFAGWALKNEGYEAGYDDGYITGNCLTSMKDLTFVAQWEKKQLSYKVEHYLQNLDGTYAAPQTYTLTAGYLDEVTAEPVSFTGFTVDESAEGTVEQGTLSSTTDTLVLKLYYTRNSYDAKWYDYDGTTLLATTRFKYGETITAPDASGSRKGYAFSGWNIGTVTMGSEGVSFNAKDQGTWTANAYTVTFHANGGEGTMDAQTFTYDATGTLHSNEFTKAGYIFAGWSVEADGGVDYVDQDEVRNLAASGNVDLYAQWEAGDGTGYTVEYYGENLDGTDYELLETRTYTGFTDASVSANAINLEGFTFDEDNANNVLTGTIEGDGSLVLEVYYTRNSYTLTLDFNGESMKQLVENTETYQMEIGGFDVEDETFTMKYGQDITQIDVKWTVLVEEHLEWDEENQEFVWVEAYEKEISFKDAFPGYTFGGWGYETMPAEDLTMTAQWMPIDVKVILYPATISYYDENGELVVDQVAGEPVEIAAKYGDVINLESYEFTYDGYFISGWNNGPDTSSVTEIVGSLVLVDGYYSGYSDYSITGYEYFGSGYMTPPGEVHLFPAWIEEEFKATISFVSNGGEGIMTPQLVRTDGGAQALKKNVFTKPGYRFLGWSTEPDGEVVYMDEEGPAWEHDVTLYAQWEEVE